MNLLGRGRSLGQGTGVAEGAGWNSSGQFGLFEIVGGVHFVGVLAGWRQD
jgi:hypothetical protein